MSHDDQDRTDTGGDRAEAPGSVTAGGGAEGPRWSRREWLGLGAATAAAVVGAGRPGEAAGRVPATMASPAAGPALADAALPQVPRRVLGRTGETIPILLMGGGVALDPRFDPKLAEGLRFGVNYVDAADCYSGGRCEPAVGAFHSRLGARNRIWITTKSDQHDPAGFERTVETSLERLRTDYVDMYFLHMLQDAAYLSAELRSVVERLKRAGKIRHFGFSCHHDNVPELLHAAARTPWVESVMFRYNFRQYGDAELNRAIDAAHAAGVGLIAMKTQASEAGIQDAWTRFEQTGKWNKFQAVLKAVWSDERITAAVSHMDNFDKLKQNVAAALDRADLAVSERSALDRYAEATRAYACLGCDHVCAPAVAAPVRIADTLRYLSYHDSYGETAEARRLFQALPEPARRLAGVDFSGANRACPHGVDVAAHMDRARRLLG